jgi:single-stranded DNA-binding protein
MSVRAIIGGATVKALELRTSKNGNPFATATIRESLNGSTRWWQAIVFDKTAIEALEEMSVGEPIAVAGEITAEIYAPAGSESRINWRITVDAVMTARKPKRKPPPENDNQTFKQRARERLLPELEEALNEGVSAASGRRIADRSLASPATAPGKKGAELDDDIPF